MALVLIVSLFFGSGCGKLIGKQEKKQPDKNQQNKKSPPKNLTILEDTTEIMIKDIQQVKDEEIKLQQQEQIEEMQKKDQENKEEAKDNKSDNKEETKGNKDDEDKNPKKTGKAEDKSSGGSKKKTLDWDKMQKSVEKLQGIWSNYINVAKKDGAPGDLVTNYGNQLDNLTTKVMRRQDNLLLDVANELYKYYPKFFDLYKHQAPPNIKDMKYHIRKIIINGEDEQWQMDKESINCIKGSWEIAKSRMDKPDRDMNKKVETAVNSFIKSVNQQNRHLVKLKGDLLIKILEEIK